MNEHDESPLVEAYLELLGRDPDAAPPDGIDPSYAEFLRTLVKSRRVPVSMNTQKRVWNRVLSENSQSRQSSHRPLLLAAVVILLVVFGIALADLQLNRSPSPNGVAALAESTATPTDIPTSTPIQDTTANADAATQTAVPTETPVGNASTNGDVATTTAVPTSTPIQDSTVNVDPSVRTQIPTVIPIKGMLNGRFSGELTDTVRSVDFTFSIPEAGILYAVAESPDFSINMGFGYSSPDNNGGGGGGGGTGDYVARTEIFAPVDAGGSATVTVTSMDGQGKGKFTLGVYHDVPQPVFLGTDLNEFTHLAGDASGKITSDKPFKALTFVATAGTQITARLYTNGNALQMPDRVGQQTADLAMSLLETPAGTAGNAILAPFGGPGQSCNVALVSIPLFCTDLDSADGLDPEFVNVTLWHDSPYTILIRPQDWTTVDGKYTFWGVQFAPTALKPGEPQAIQLANLTPIRVYKTPAQHDKTVTLDLALTEGLTPVTVKVMQKGQLLQTVKLTDHQPVSATVQPLFDDDLLIYVEYGDQTNANGYRPPTTITLTQR